MLATFRDRFGLPLTATSADAVERYVEGIDRHLAMRLGDAECLESSLAVDGGFALAHAALALLRQGQGNAAGARDHAEQARALAAGASAREQGHAQAVWSLVHEGGERSLALVRRHLQEFPGEALLLLHAAFLIHFSGRQERQVEEHALLQQASAAYTDDWWFPGFFGFACQELNQFGEASALAERSLARESRSTWAAHTLAHVAYETDNPCGGAAFLTPWLATYDERAPYFCHLSWHRALFALAGGDLDETLTIYERDINPAVHPTGYRLADAASLLWRCQLRGATRELPWATARDRANGEAPTAGSPFADAHAALAYAGAGDAAGMERLLAGLRQRAAEGHLVADAVVLPLAEGIAAFARADYAAAIRHLLPVRGQIVRIGGSNAQRDVFTSTLIESCLRAGRPEQAEALIRERLARRGRAAARA